MISLAGTGLLLKKIEVSYRQGRLPFLEAALGPGQQQPETALPHFRVHAVECLGVGQPVEGFADCATALGCTDQIEQRLKVLGVSAPPGLSLGFGAFGLTLVIVRDQRTKHLRIRVRRPCPLQ